MHVIAQTRALGERLSDEGAQPEVYRWRDGSGSSVSCEFEGGKLARWKLERPEQVLSGRNGLTASSRTRWSAARGR